MKPLNPLVLPKNISFKTTDKESNGADKPIQTLLYRMYIAGRGKISQKELDAVFRKAVGGTVANTQGVPYLPDATPAQLWDAMTPKQRKANGMHLHILKALGEWATGRISGPLGAEDYFKVEKGRWEVDKDAAEKLCSHSFKQLPKTLKAIFTNTDIRYRDKKKEKEVIITLLDHKWGDDDQSLNIKGYQDYLKQIKRFERLRDLAMEQYLQHIEATLQQWTQKHKVLKKENPDTAKAYFISSLLKSPEVGFLFEGDPDSGVLGISARVESMSLGAPDMSVNAQLHTIAHDYITESGLVRMEPLPFGQQQLDEYENKKEKRASLQLDSPFAQNKHLILVDGKPLKIKNDYVIHCPNEDEAIYIARTLAFAHDADTMIVRVDKELKVVIVEEALPLIKGTKDQINARLRRVTLQRKNLSAALSKDTPKKTKVEILHFFASDSDLNPQHHESVSQIRVGKATGNDLVIDDIFEKKARIPIKRPHFLKRTWRFLGRQANNLKWFLSDALFSAPRPQGDAKKISDDPYELTPEQAERYREAIDIDIALYYKNAKEFFQESIGEDISKGPLSSPRLTQLTEKLEQKIEEQENLILLAIEKVDAAKQALLLGQYPDPRDAAQISSIPWYLSQLQLSEDPDADLRMKTGLVEYWIHQTYLLFNTSTPIDPAQRNEAILQIIYDTPLYLWPAKDIQILELQKKSSAKATDLDGIVILLQGIAVHERTIDLAPLKIHRCKTAITDYIEPWKKLLNSSGELFIDINELCTMHYRLKIDDIYMKLTSFEYQNRIDQMATLFSDPSFGDHKEKLKELAEKLATIIDDAEKNYLAHLGPEQSLYALKRHTEVLRAANKKLQKAYRSIDMLPITESDKEDLRHAVIGLFTVLFYIQEWARLELEPSLHHDLTKFTDLLRSFLDLFVVSAKPNEESHWVQEFLVFIKSLDDGLILQLFDCWGNLFESIVENQGQYDLEDNKQKAHLNQLIFILERMKHDNIAQLNVAQRQYLHQWLGFFKKLNDGGSITETPETWEDNAARILNAEPMTFLGAKRLRKNIHGILSNFVAETKKHAFANPSLYPQWLLMLDAAIKPAAKDKKAGPLHWELSSWPDQAAFQLYSAHAELKLIYETFQKDPGTKNMGVQGGKLSACWEALDKAVGHLFEDNSQPTIQQQVSLSASFGALIEQFQLIFDASIVDSTSTINDVLRKFTGFFRTTPMGDGTNAIEMQQMLMVYLGVYYTIMRRVISGEIGPDVIYAILPSQDPNNPKEVKDAVNWSDLHPGEITKAVSILVQKTLLDQNDTLEHPLRGWGLDPLQINIKEAVYSMQESVGPTLLYKDVDNESQPTDFSWLDGFSKVAQPKTWTGPKGAIQEALQKPDHPIFDAIDYAQDIGAMAANDFKQTRAVLDPNAATISIKEMNRGEKNLHRWCNAMYQLDKSEQNSMTYSLLTQSGIDEVPNTNPELSIYHKAYSGVQSKEDFKINNTVDICKRIAEGYADVEKNLCGALTAVHLLGDGKGVDPTTTQLVLPGTTSKSEIDALIKSGQYHYYTEIETLYGPVYYLARVHEPEEIQSSVIKIISDLEKLEAEMNVLNKKLESSKLPQEKRDKILTELGKKSAEWANHPWAKLTSDRRQWLKATFTDKQFLEKLNDEKVWRQVLSFSALFAEVFVSAVAAYRMAGIAIVPLAARTGLPATRGVMFALARVMDSVFFTTIHTLFDGHASKGRYLHDLFVNFLLVLNGTIWGKITTEPAQRALHDAILKGLDRATIAALKKTLARQGVLTEGLVVVMTTLILSALGYLEQWIRHDKALDGEQTMHMAIENFVFVLALHLANRGRTNAAFDYDQGKINELTDTYIGHLQTLYRTRSANKEEFLKKAQEFNTEIKAYIGDKNAQAALLIRNGIASLPMQGEMIGIWHRVQPALKGLLNYELISPWKAPKPTKTKPKPESVTKIPPVSNGFKIVFPAWVKKGTKVLLTKLFGEMSTGIFELGERARWLIELYNDVIDMQSSFDAETTYTDLLATRKWFEETIVEFDIAYREAVKNDATALALWELAAKILRSSFNETYQKTLGVVSTEYAKYSADFEESSILIESILGDIDLGRINENLSLETVAELKAQYELALSELRKQNGKKPVHIQEDAWSRALDSTGERYDILFWYYEQLATKLHEIRGQQKRASEIADAILENPNLSDTTLPDIYSQLENGTIRSLEELLVLLNAAEKALTELRHTELPAIYADSPVEYRIAIDFIAKRFHDLFEREQQRIQVEEETQVQKDGDKTEQETKAKTKRTKKEVDKHQSDAAYRTSKRSLPENHPLLQVLAIDPNTPFSEAFIRFALDFWPVGQESPNFHVLEQAEYASIVFNGIDGGSSNESMLVLVTPLDYSPSTYLRITQGYSAGYALHNAHTILQGFGYQSGLSGPAIHTFNHTIQVQNQPYSRLLEERPAVDVVKDIKSLETKALELLQFVIDSINEAFATDNLPIAITIADLYFNCPLNQVQQAVDTAVTHRGSGEDANSVLPHIMPYLHITLRPEKPVTSVWFSAPHIQAEAFWQSVAGQSIVHYINNLSTFNESTLSHALNLSVEALAEFNRSDDSQQRTQVENLVIEEVRTRFNEQKKVVEHTRLESNQTSNSFTHPWISEGVQTVSGRFNAFINEPQLQGQSFGSPQSALSTVAQLAYRHQVLLHPSNPNQIDSTGHLVIQINTEQSISIFATENIAQAHYRSMQNLESEGFGPSVQTAPTAWNCLTSNPPPQGLPYFFIHNNTHTQTLEGTKAKWGLRPDQQANVHAAIEALNTLIASSITTPEGYKSSLSLEDIRVHADDPNSFALVPDILVTWNENQSQSGPVLPTLRRAFENDNISLHYPVKFKNDIDIDGKKRAWPTIDENHPLHSFLNSEGPIQDGCSVDFINFWKEAQAEFNKTVFDVAAVVRIAQKHHVLITNPSNRVTIGIQVNAEVILMFDLNVTSHTWRAPNRTRARQELSRHYYIGNKVFPSFVSKPLADSYPSISIGFPRYSAFIGQLTNWAGGTYGVSLFKESPGSNVNYSQLTRAFVQKYPTYTKSFRHIMHLFQKHCMHRLKTINGAGYNNNTGLKIAAHHLDQAIEILYQMASGEGSNSLIPIRLTDTQLSNKQLLALAEVFEVSPSIGWQTTQSHYWGSRPTEPLPENIVSGLLNPLPPKFREKEPPKADGEPAFKPVAEPQKNQQIQQKKRVPNILASGSQLDVRGRPTDVTLFFKKMHPKDKPKLHRRKSDNRMNIRFLGAEIVSTGEPVEKVPLLVILQQAVHHALVYDVNTVEVFIKHKNTERYLRELNKHPTLRKYWKQYPDRSGVYLRLDLKVAPDNVQKTVVDHALAQIGLELGNKKINAKTLNSTFEWWSIIAQHCPMEATFDGVVSTQSALPHAFNINNPKGRVWWDALHNSTATKKLQDQEATYLTGLQSEGAPEYLHVVMHDAEMRRQATYLRPENYWWNARLAIENATNILGNTIYKAKLDLNDVGLWVSDNSFNASDFLNQVIIKARKIGLTEISIRVHSDQHKNIFQEARNRGYDVEDNTIIMDIPNPVYLRRPATEYMPLLSENKKVTDVRSKTTKYSLPKSLEKIDQARNTFQEMVIGMKDPVEGRAVLTKQQDRDVFLVDVFSSSVNMSDFLAYVRRWVLSYPDLKKVTIQVRSWQGGTTTKPTKVRDWVVRQGSHNDTQWIDYIAIVNAEQKLPEVVANIIAKHKDPPEKKVHNHTKDEPVNLATRFSLAEWEYKKQYTKKKQELYDNGNKVAGKENQRWHNKIRLTIKDDTLLIDIMRPVQDLNDLLKIFILYAREKKVSSIRIAFQYELKNALGPQWVAVESRNRFHHYRYDHRADQNVQITYKHFGSGMKEKDFEAHIRQTAIDIGAQKPNWKVQRARAIYEKSENGTLELFVDAEIGPTSPFEYYFFDIISNTYEKRVDNIHLRLLAKNPNALNIDPDVLRSYGWVEEDPTTAIKKGYRDFYWDIDVFEKNLSLFYSEHKLKDEKPSDFRARISDGIAVELSTMSFKQNLRQDPNSMHPKPFSMRALVLDGNRLVIDSFYMYQTAAHFRWTLRNIEKIAFEYRQKEGREDIQTVEFYNHDRHFTSKKMLIPKQFLGEMENKRVANLWKQNPDNRHVYTFEFTQGDSIPALKSWFDGFDLSVLKLDGNHPLSHLSTRWFLDTAHDIVEQSGFSTQNPTWILALGDLIHDKASQMLKGQTNVEIIKQANHLKELSKATNEIWYARHTGDFREGAPYLNETSDMRLIHKSSNQIDFLKHTLDTQSYVNNELVPYLREFGFTKTQSVDLFIQANTTLKGTLRVDADSKLNTAETIQLLEALQGFVAEDSSINRVRVLLNPQRSLDNLPPGWSQPKGDTGYLEYKKY